MRARGFTLIEVMIWIAIIGICAAILESRLREDRGGDKSRPVPSAPGHRN